MLRRTALKLAILTVATVALSATAQAQSDRFFRILDRNENGQVDPDEWERFPQLRDYAQSQGTDLTRPLSETDVTRISERWSESQNGQRSEGEGRRDGDRDDEDRDRDNDRDRERNCNDDDDDNDDDRDRERRAAESSPATATTSPAAAPPADPNSKVVRSAGRNRAPLVVALPEEYKSRDINRDGQIGLYEWPRTDFATFRKLDQNGDGFITPRELTAPTTTTVAVNLATPVSNGGPPGFGGPQGFGRDRGGDRGGGRDSRRSYGFGMGSDPAARAEMTFNMLDRNRDGSVNPDEFSRSRTIRPMFERASIDVSKSMTKVDFLANFAKVNATPAQ
jgi:hypothetical protein